MVFTSAIFLFYFLPIVTAGYFLCRGITARNIWLLVASLAFYTYGEARYLLLLEFIFFFNFGLSFLLSGKNRRTWLFVAIAGNLLIFAYYKYSGFIVENFNFLTGGYYLLPKVALPLGISFFLFQIMAYMVDVYRGDVPVQRDPVKLALYKVLFPQMIAGPIVRYREVRHELDERSTSRDDFTYGVFRFGLGLSKKVLIADTLGYVADQIFPTASFVVPTTTALAWLAALAYTLQIYFDFSGYSDMAIGLGRIFGFRFNENFRLPYACTSVTDFWRRWHISLSTWFRDYLYVPLGGNRRGKCRTYLNLFTVFFFCGLWHGASWSFVVWGLYHGFFLVLERVAPFRLGRVATLLVVVCGWVIFRATELPQALEMLKSMFVFKAASAQDWYQLHLLFTHEVALAFLVGGFFATMDFSRWKDWSVSERMHPAAAVMLAVCVFFAVAKVVEGTFQPFIYFRF